MSAHALIWGYVLRMNSAFHINPLSSPAGDVSGSALEFWGADLALRIWLWLSQIYSHYARASQSPLAARLLRSTFLREAYSPFRAAQVGSCQGQACHCGSCKTISGQIINPRPNRHRRRMIARRARGIMPLTRYMGLYLRPLLPTGLSPTQYLEAELRISPLGRLQSYNWKYHVHDFFRRGAMKARAGLGCACTQVSALCDARLSPD